MSYSHYLNAIVLTITSVLVGCSERPTNGNAVEHYQINQLCGSKPNCVSTLDHREAHQLDAFLLSDKGATATNWPLIRRIALNLPGASLANEQADYFRVECTSALFRFVDDFEVKREGNTLTVRSESRVGYSDFGVNRERAALFRQQLSDAGFLKD